MPVRRIRKAVSDMNTRVHPNQLDLCLSQPADPAAQPRDGVVVARLSIPVREHGRPTARSKPVVERRVDWFKVITDLSKTGHTPHIVSVAIGVARTTLIGWKQGAEPRYTEGERLVSLWCRVLRKDRSKLPTVAISDFWSYHSKA